MLCLTVFRLTDNLSRSLQSTKRTAVSATKLAADVIEVLKSMRKDDSFNAFWTRVNQTQRKLGKGFELTVGWTTI